MPISIKNARSVATLAAVSASDDDLPYIASELETIIAWINQLQAVDVSDVQLNSDVQSMPERADRVIEHNMCSKILANAPDVVDQWFAVPKIIK
jgi:aspartyl-tRNA(Asn)/glutamyl-tRNA(Gln) amidotransferase subunit C